MLGHFAEQAGTCSSERYGVTRERKLEVCHRRVNSYPCLRGAKDYCVLVLLLSCENGQEDLAADRPKMTVLLGVLF